MTKFWIAVVGVVLALGPAIFAQDVVTGVKDASKDVAKGTEKGAKATVKGTEKAADKTADATDGPDPAARTAPMILR